jgi:LysM repeat protein
VTLLPLWANGESSAVTSPLLVPTDARRVARVDVCALFPTACLPAEDEVKSLLSRQDVTLTPEAVAGSGEPVITAAPTPTPEPLPTMTVRPGDTLVALANWFGVTPFEIAATNGFAVDDYLQIGWVLAIPVPLAEFTAPPDPQAAVAAAVEPAPAPAPAAPQPTPAPVTPAPYIPRSSEEVIAAICALPWPCEQMVRIASCESGLNPRAYNPAGYYGLFQISNNIENWDDPVINANFAYYNKYLPALSRGNGFSPWPVCQYY